MEIGMYLLRNSSHTVKDAERATLKVPAFAMLATVKEYLPVLSHCAMVVWLFVVAVAKGECATRATGTGAFGGITQCLVDRTSV